MLDVLNQWIAQYGVVLVGVFLLVETAGIPIPGETALVTAAALAGRGALPIGWVVAAGFAGTILGSHLGYWIGARGGARLLATHGRWLGLTEARLAKTHAFFEQHGSKTVALGRFVAFVRSFLGISAGLSGMPFWTFAFYNALGGALWVAAFSTLGYAFGRNLPRLIFYIGRVSLLLAILVAIVAGLAVLWRWYSRNRGRVIAALDARYEQALALARAGGDRIAPTGWRLTLDRLARNRYLALHLVLGFAASLVVIAVFASITEDLVENSPLTRFDMSVADRLRESLSPGAAHAFAFLSSLGGRGAMTLLLLAGVARYAARRRWLETAGWSAAFLGGGLLDAALRLVVRRSELPFADIVLLRWGGGLASGHALGVVLGYGMLAFLLYEFVQSRAGRAVLVACAAAVVGMILISRLYLGQQFVSDAAAGLAAGLLWLAACVSGIEIARQRHW